LAGYDIVNFQVFVNKSKSVTVTLNQTFKIGPDLAAISLNFSDDFPLLNETITLTVQIKNVGNFEFDNSLSNVSVHFFVNDNLTNISTNIPSLPVLASTEVSVNWLVNVTNGTHSIKVQVDPDGNLSDLDWDNNTIIKDIIVNSIPIAILSVEPNITLTLTEIIFNASDSFKEITDVPIQEYIYDFGDGTTSGWVTEDHWNHSYNNDGIYVVRVRVRDASGQESKWSKDILITVLNRAPVANFTFNPASGDVTTDFVFDPSSSIDLDGTVVNYYWGFSNGSNSNFFITNSTEPTPQIKFNDDIEYNITLTVWDDDGMVSENITKTLKIQNLPPVPVFTFTPDKINLTIQDLLTFNANGTTDPDDDTSTFDYTWDFDDGSFEYHSAIVQHNFSAPGIYNVTLYVFDDDGDSGRYSLEINITEIPKESTDKDETGEADLFWVIVGVVLVLVIFFILIMLFFVMQSKKIRTQLEGPGKGLEGGPGALSGTGLPTDFTTAGKLDFVILKRKVGKRYTKFELHKTTRSPQEFVGIIWKSAFLDSSWQLKDKILGSKGKVIDYLQLKILANTGKDWLVDYNGNGTILTKSLSTKTSIGSVGAETVSLDSIYTITPKPKQTKITELDEEEKTESEFGSESDVEVEADEKPAAENQTSDDDLPSEQKEEPATETNEKKESVEDND
jgi:PKD repeat protein